MGKFLAGSVLLVLVVVLVVGDITARVYAQRQLEHLIESKVPAANAKVSISSFPFLGRLAVSGSVPKVRAHVTNVTSGSFTFDSIDLVVTRVQLDRTKLFADERVVPQQIDSGTVTADLTEGQLDRAVGGQPVRLGQGVVLVPVRGATVPARLSVVGNQLRVEAPGAPAVAIPKLPVLPCAANVVVTPQHVELSCAFRQIPPALLRGAG